MSDDPRDWLRTRAEEIRRRRPGDPDIAALVGYLEVALEWEASASHTNEATGRMVRELSAYVPVKVHRRLLAEELARF